MRRERQAGLAVGALVLAFAGAALACSSNADGSRGGTRGPSVGPTTTLTRAALEAPEGWRKVARSPLSGRSDAAAAWTGDELVVWGGHGAFSDAGGGDPARTDGAAYDPRSRRWRRLPRAPLPGGQNVVGAADYASAWTGRELLVWGGPGPEAAAYDPQADRWRKVDPGPAGERIAFGSAWTGRELVIAGGGTPLRRQPDRGARSVLAHDPAAGTWRSLPDLPFPIYYPSVVWDGERILVFGTRSGGRAVRVLSLDPADGKAWVEGPSSTQLVGDATALWTGSELVVAGSGGGPQRRTVVATYDPMQERWGDLPQPFPDEVPFISPSLVWTGREAVLLGAPMATSADGPGHVRGAAFDPRSRTWRSLLPPLSPRGGATAAWADDRLLVWGGELSNGFTSDPRADGAEYRPGPGR